MNTANTVPVVTASPSAPIPSTPVVATTSASTPIPTSPDLSSILGTDPSLDSTFRSISRYIRNLPQPVFSQPAVTIVCVAPTVVCVAVPVVPVATTRVDQTDPRLVQGLLNFINSGNATTILTRVTNTVMTPAVLPPTIPVVTLSSDSEIENNEVSPVIDRIIPTVSLLNSSTPSSGNSFIDEINERNEREKLTSVLPVVTISSTEPTVSTGVMSFLSDLPPVRLQISINAENSTASTSSK